MDVWVWLSRKRSTEELMLLTCGVGETLESPSDCEEIQPVHPKGDQSWIFIRRTDVETETPILWPPDMKDWFLGKDPDAGNDWRQEEKGAERMRCLDSITDSIDMNLSKLWHAAVREVAKSQTRLSDWTELKWTHESREQRLDKKLYVCGQIDR